MSSEEINSFFTRYIRASFALTPGKPAFLRGLRVAIILGVPILYGLFTGLLPGALLFMMAALNVTLMDMGGMTYRKTSRIMLLTTLLNAVAAAVALLSGLHILTACIMTAVWLAAVAMLGLLGHSGVMMGFVNSAIFVMMIAHPNNLNTALYTFIIFIAGGLWAMLLSLIAWPISPYRPVQKAIARCFKENASFLKTIASQCQDEVDTPQPTHNQNAIDVIHRKFCEGIDQAHEMLSNERKGRFSKVDVEDALISLLQSVSKDHRSLMTMTVWFQRKGEKTILSKSKGFGELFNDLAGIQDEIARLIMHANVSERVLLAKVDSLKEKYLIKKNQIISGQFKEIHNILEQALERFKTEVFLAAGQHPYFRRKKVKIHHEALIPDSGVPFITMLRNNLTFKSSCFRHAIRIGITSALAVLIAHLMHLPRGFWVPLTVVVIMAPDFGGAFLIRTLQRGAGTILGGLFAVLVISQTHNQILIFILLIVFAFIAISMLTINYAVFVFFLTPLIVTVYSITDAGDWHIPLDRVLDTLTGMGLALLGGHLLFPVWERDRFPERISSMLNTVCSYFNEVLSALTGEEVVPRRLSALNRKMELTASNADASLQRTLTQPGLNSGLIIPMMSFLNLSNRFMRNVISLHEYATLNNIKAGDAKEFLPAGRKMSGLLHLMAENILLQKSKESLSNDKLIEVLHEMKNIAKQIDAKPVGISSEISSGESLLAIEFKRLTEVEHSMFAELGLYLSKRAHIKLPDDFFI